MDYDDRLADLYISVERAEYEKLIRERDALRKLYTEENNDRAKAVEERDHWKRLFNRLEGAIAHHYKGKTGEVGFQKFFNDEVDDSLHAAWRRILKDAARVFNE